MNKRIVYSRPDGRVSIITPALLADETEDAAIERVRAEAVPPGTPSYLVDAADVPSDRTLRDRWRYEPGQGFTIAPES